jgi:hypothetical protein
VQDTLGVARSALDHASEHALALLLEKVELRVEHLQDTACNVLQLRSLKRSGRACGRPHCIARAEPGCASSSQKLAGCVRNISNSLARKLQRRSNSTGGARACCGVLVALSDDPCDTYVRVPAMWPMLFVVTSCRFWPGRYVTMTRSAGAFAGYAPATGVPTGAIHDPPLASVSMNEGGMPGLCCCGPTGRPKPPPL